MRGSDELREFFRLAGESPQKFFVADVAFFKKIINFRMNIFFAPPYHFRNSISRRNFGNVEEVVAGIHERILMSVRRKKFEGKVFVIRQHLDFAAEKMRFLARIEINRHRRVVIAENIFHRNFLREIKKVIENQPVLRVNFKKFRLQQFKKIPANYELIHASLRVIEKPVEVVARMKIIHLARAEMQIGNENYIFWQNLVLVFVSFYHKIFSIASL